MLTPTSTQAAAQPELAQAGSFQCPALSTHIRLICLHVKRAAEIPLSSAAGRPNQADAERSGVSRCLPQRGEEGQVQSFFLQPHDTSPYLPQIRGQVHSPVDCQVYTPALSHPHLQLEPSYKPLIEPFSPATHPGAAPRQQPTGNAGT